MAFHALLQRKNWAVPCLPKLAEKNRDAAELGRILFGQLNVFFHGFLGAAARDTWGN